MKKLITLLMILLLASSVPQNNALHAMDALNEEIGVCNICGCRYNNKAYVKITLPCEHAVCATCLESIIVKQSYSYKEQVPFKHICPFFRWGLHPSRI